MATKPENDIAIDEHQLDREWVAQPALYYRYARELADAQQDHAALKAELDVVKAELDGQLRASPEDYGLAKVTEAAISAAIPQQPPFKKATKDVIESRHRVDVLQAAVSAIDHRKRALENLVSLHLAGYYAAPHAPDGAKEDLDEMEKTFARGGGRRRRREVETDEE